MNVRCGHCTSDFRDATRAAKHVASHDPIVRKPSPGRPIWTVRWNLRTGEIAEVLNGPKMGYE